MGQADYGKERKFGAIFWAVGAVLEGILIDWNQGDFGVLYVFVVIAGLASCLALQLFAHSMMQQESSIPASSPVATCHAAESTPLMAAVENNVLGADKVSGTVETSTHDASKDNITMPSWSIVLAIVSTIYGIGFIVSFLTLNAGTSIVEGLIFTWFLELGASYTFCGLTVALTVLFEIPLFEWSPDLLKTYGRIVSQSTRKK